MSLKNKQIRHLKALAHHLKPVVTIGAKGLTPTVLKEIEHAVESHELIKIKLPAAIKTEKQQLAEQICTQCKTYSVSLTGRVLITYRANSSKENSINLQL